MNVDILNVNYWSSTREYDLFTYIWIKVLVASYTLKCFLLYHAVLLGSIQELPAESCSEIKASEGNEMVNGDYWIYSDRNGQTILARCEGVACIC